MKVLDVFDTVDPSSGGPIAAYIGWAEVLQKHGIIPEVLSLDDPSSGLDRDFPFKLTMIGHQPMLGGRTYRYSSKMVQWIRAHAPDYTCVTAHNIWTYSAFGTARALRHSATPYLIFVHGMLDPWFRQRYPVKHIKKQLYWSLALGRAMQGARKVLFTTEDERELATGAFKGHPRYPQDLVRLGTADVPGQDPDQLAAFYRICPSLKGRRFVLFLSRIHPKKGCDLLIQAFSAVAAKHPDIDLVMAGPDVSGWRVTLESLAADMNVQHRIHWPGMLQGNAKHGAFRAAELFALPSHQENFGVAVAEALAFGLPVLITKRVNIWRAVVQAGAGLAGMDDVEGTAASLCSLLALPAAERERMQDAARSLFLQEFEVSRTAEDMVRLIREIGR